MRAEETRALAKKKKAKQKSVSTITVTKPWNTVDTSHNFCTNIFFGEASLHLTETTVTKLVSSSLQQSQRILTLQLSKNKTTVESLTKAKEKKWKSSQKLLFVLQKSCLSSAVIHAPKSGWKHNCDSGYKFPFISTPKNTLFKSISQLLLTTTTKRLRGWWILGELRKWKMFRIIQIHCLLAKRAISLD